MLGVARFKSPALPPPFNKLTDKSAPAPKQI